MPGISLPRRRSCTQPAPAKRGRLGIWLGVRPRGSALPVGLYERARVEQRQVFKVGSSKEGGGLIKVGYFNGGQACDLQDAEIDEVIDEIECWIRTSLDIQDAIIPFNKPCERAAAPLMK